MKKIILTIVAVSALVFTSCSKDKNEPVKKPVEAPATYKFERNGKNTVSFSGQTERIKMAEELRKAFKNTAKTEAQLKGMFAHQKGGQDFSDASLNSSKKSIRSKVAASRGYFSANSTEANAIRKKFDGFITKQVTEVFPNWDKPASAGVAGKLQESGGGKTRYINAKGLEYDQAYAKALIGALMVDQMLNNYLSTAVLDEADNRAKNDAGTVAEGKTYTTMEHKWDEAYGYLYGNEADPAKPTLGADSFLNKYLDRVNKDTDFAGIADDIYNAFKLGRAAIVAKDYTLRDAQVKIIREKVSQAVAIRTAYYLQTGKAKLKTNQASAFHDLSEAYGFIQSLRFTRNPKTDKPYLSADTVNGYLTDLQAGNGFWDVKVEKLDKISKEIATAYGFDLAKVSN